MNDEREFLERSLADLDREREAGDLSDDDFTDLKARYERKLAALPEASCPNPPRQGASGWGKKLITALLVLAVGIGGGLAVARSSGSRKPGDTITGNVPAGTQEQLAQAAELTQQGDVLEALKVYDAVLAENPEDPSALTYKGWLLRNVGIENAEPELAEQGVSYLEQALEIDPTFSEAWLFRGIIFLRDEESPEQAVDALKLALANDPIPEVAAAARELLSEIQTAP